MNRLYLHLPLIAFCLLGTIWGSNFIYMKMAAAYISPTQIVFFRVLFGFIPVFIYALFSRALQWKQLRHSIHFLVMALLATVIYYFGFATATSLLLSGVAGALSGAIPFFSFILALIFIAEEKLSLYKFLGISIGLIGVIMLGRPTGADLSNTNLEGVLYMILGSSSVGTSFVYAKKFITPLKIPAVALTTYQLGFGLFLLALITDYKITDEIWSDSHAAAGLIIGLGLLGTGLAFILYYYIVQKLGVVVASSSTYIPPVVALLIGSLLVNEPIGVLDFIATGLIFAGVFLLRK